MEARSVLGETGETLLVGSDKKLRSSLRHQQGDLILNKHIETEGTKDIFSRKPTERGKGICTTLIFKDYRDEVVLGHNHYLAIMDWAIMTKIDAKEAFTPIVLLGNTIAVIFITFVILSILSAIIAANKIARPIRELATTAEEIATGNLTQPININSNDEIGLLADSFKIMVEGLSSIIAKMKDAINQVNAAGMEILSASQQQASSAREQSSAISETASAAEELSKSAETVGENTKRISQVANHTLVGMAKTKDIMGKTATTTTSLNEKSQKIGQIIELISDVADQTNLLAVNAAIEAARAGEEGRGFTVVADEIRKLADSTANSTKDITSLIELIQNDVINASMSMEQSIASLDEELSLAQETSEQSKEISMSVGQQVGGSRQIAEAMSNANEAMKQISAGAQQTQISAEQLKHLSEELTDLTTKFKTDISE